MCVASGGGDGGGDGGVVVVMMVVVMMITFSHRDVSTTIDGCLDTISSVPVVGVLDVEATRYDTLDMLSYRVPIDRLRVDFHPSSVSSRSSPDVYTIDASPIERVVC